MEKKTEQSVLPNQHLTPPVESHVTAVLNGIGNGMMIGALPFVAVELYDKVSSGEKKIPKKTIGKIGMFATVAGCLIGAVYGVYESRRLKHYRDDVNAEINKLRALVDEHEIRLKLSENTATSPTDDQAKSWGRKVKENADVELADTVPSR